MLNDVYFFLHKFAIDFIFLLLHDLLHFRYASDSVILPFFPNSLSKFYLYVCRGRSKVMFSNNQALERNLTYCFTHISSRTKMMHKSVNWLKTEPTSHSNLLISIQACNFLLFNMKQLTDLPNNCHKKQLFNFSPNSLIWLFPSSNISLFFSSGLYTITYVH